MIIISKRGAIKVFYYLMSIDGISDEEEKWFETIGKELFGDGFKEFGGRMAEECQNHIDTAEADERLDVIMEGIDKALNDRITKPEYGMASRHLVWNMLALAYCDGYTEDENRIISHVARVLNIDKSVCL